MRSNWLKSALAALLIFAGRTITCWKLRLAIILFFLPLNTHPTEEFRINEIQGTIVRLRDDANQAVDSMNEASSKAEHKASDVADVAELLRFITSQIVELDELNSQIALAAEQQNLAAEEININVTRVC